MRQWLLQDAVIDDDLEGPRLQQLGGRHTHGAHSGQEQTPLDPLQVGPEDLAKTRAFPWSHG